ncbi:MAG: hypothetical protein Harvfovirus18_21 [Harvfovirus sp.]|uniref:Uncharacterized protein n=1 Tax=Harvfovirus sp. TaxID=2487768 RepID=A0A3G5A5R0_9VIRU|nr:MAG: hypothetical protein Harvfovirus18_21 [Harvfovirus sp.]
MAAQPCVAKMMYARIMKTKSKKIPIFITEVATGLSLDVIFNGLQGTMRIDLSHCSALVKALKANQTCCKDFVENLRLELVKIAAMPPIKPAAATKVDLKKVKNKLSFDRGVARLRDSQFYGEEGEMKIEVGILISDVESESYILNFLVMEAFKRNLICYFTVLRSEPINKFIQDVFDGKMFPILDDFTGKIASQVRAILNKIAGYREQYPDEKLVIETKRDNIIMVPSGPLNSCSTADCRVPIGPSRELVFGEEGKILLYERILPALDSNPLCVKIFIVLDESKSKRLEVRCADHFGFSIKIGKLIMNMINGEEGSAAFHLRLSAFIIRLQMGMCALGGMDLPNLSGKAIRYSEAIKAKPMTDPKLVESKIIENMDGDTLCIFKCIISSEEHGPFEIKVTGKSIAINKSIMTLRMTKMGSDERIMFLTSEKVGSPKDFYVNVLYGDMAGQLSDLCDKISYAVIDMFDKTSHLIEPGE